jgi:hypothetical protein
MGKTGGLSLCRESFFCRQGEKRFTQRRKGGAQRAQRKELNRKERKEKAQRGTRTFLHLRRNPANPLIL